MVYENLKESKKMSIASITRGIMKKQKNRKQRKKRKIELKRQGLEAFTPTWDSIITTSPDSFPFKIAKHFKGMEIQAGKLRLRGYEFTRSISK